MIELQYKSSNSVADHSMPLHDTLSRLMLAVDRVGSRLGSAGVLGNEEGGYEIQDYVPKEEFSWFYALHEADTGKDYIVVLEDNPQFHINKAFAQMLSQLIAAKICRWTGQEDNQFDMPDVTEAEFTYLLELVCGKTRVVRADCMERYIQITLRYFFPETLQQALVDACLNRMEKEIKDAQMATELEKIRIDKRHEELLKAVRPVTPLPKLYLYSSDHIQDKTQLHAGHYYGYKTRSNKVPVLFLGCVFNSRFVYIRDNDVVSSVHISQLYQLVSFDDIRPNGMKPSAGYFTKKEFNRDTDGDCVGEYFECYSDKLHRTSNFSYAGNAVIVWLLGYNDPDTACVFYDNNAWYIETKNLSLIKQETLNSEELAEQIERNAMIAESTLRHTDVQCSPDPVTNRAELKKGDLYGCRNQVFAQKRDGISRTFGTIYFVSVLYLGPCIKHPDGVYIYYNDEEYLVQTKELHKINPPEEY